MQLIFHALKNWALQVHVAKDNSIVGDSLSRWCFLRSFLTASKPNRRSITAQTEKKRRKRRGEKKFKIEKPKELGHFFRPKTLIQNFDFCACPSQNVVKCDASGKKGKLSCCKCIFDQMKANLAEIQPENHQNFQKTHFLQKAPRVNGLIKDFSDHGASKEPENPLL